MFARIWKEDKLAFWSAEEFLEAFQREEFYRGYILEATPFEEVFCCPVDSERDAMRSFSWCYYILCYEIVDPSEVEEGEM
ncbi:hypothetical protein F511_39734 [Dorcoceras hygrometricum]|uniref:Uncharacterized protein n=1 Tax=Dorcoceras hygrometricum TaxID=472368 RepID=A0A2Z7CPC5_9LAMI|nr:hypothetical protein F511_39734 [Dorcoceras hygrometricum]